MKWTIILTIIIGMTATTIAQNKPLDGKCYIIGHRGAPGYGGENTLWGFEKALDLGADGFEIDLVQTKDGKLIVGHDYKLERLLGEEQLGDLFPDKKKKDHWYITDFTFDELRTMKVTFPAPDTDRYNYKELGEDYMMPSLAETLALLKRKRSELNRPDLKIYIEIKTKKKHDHTMTLQEISDQIKSDLTEAGLIDDPNVWIQSFDYDMMDVIAAEPAFANLDKTQLSFDSAREILQFSKKRRAKKYLKKKILNRNLQILHVWKVPVRRIIDTKKVPMIEMAHSMGIPIHLYTFRDPQHATDYASFPIYKVEGFSNEIEELQYFMKLGVDAVMTDYVTSAIEARERLQN